jgi:hypothetical protein
LGQLSLLSLQDGLWGIHSYGGGLLREGVPVSWQPRMGWVTEASQGRSLNGTGAGCFGGFSGCETLGRGDEAPRRFLGAFCMESWAKS